MIIKKLTIMNFRSYYGVKIFNFSDGLNLILGSNGDGKTTFFDAINWVLTPDYAPKADDDRLPELSSLVSAKYFKELNVGVKGRVVVSLDVKNNSGQPRIIERAFNVFKQDNGEMRIEGATHKAYQMVGSMRKEILTLREVFEKESVFPAVLKKYHIFKGEDKLNIFQDQSTLQNLIDMFSDVKDLDPFVGFATYATKTSGQVIEGTREKNSKQDAKVLGLNKDIVSLSKQLEKVETELAQERKAYNEACKQIEAIESDYETINKVADYEKEIAQLEKEVERLADKIDEDYSCKLLDEQWILLGFEPILKEFKRKMDSNSYSKNNIESEYRRKQEEEFNQERVSQAKTELENIAWNRSDVEKMKGMLVAHRCAYCGTEALEGSITYDFIKQRINDVIKLLTPQPDAKKLEIKTYFKERNIEGVHEIAMGLIQAGKNISGIKDEIESAYHENDKIRELIHHKTSEINSKKRKIASLYANSSSGENLKEYVSNVAIVNRWHDQKQQSAISIERLLSKTIPELKEQIKKKRDERAKYTKDTGVDLLQMTHDFFRLLGSAFENTESAIYEEFLNKLAKVANGFLSMLNVDDFTGEIKIYMDMYNVLKIELRDRNNKLITNPNTSLLTTMYISILFAISELTRENTNAQYPIIFDAPTSSFDEGKDKTFYECLNSYVDRQCIVVTKSYLYKNQMGEFITDKQALDRLNCKKFRIKKLTGFDQKDITTIDTEIEEMKED